MKYSQSVIAHNGLSWFSEEYRIIYLGIPKTASTSMRHTFKIDKNGMKLYNIPEDKKDYKVFTVIRNPLNRFVSGMFESFKRGETPANLKALFTVGDTIEMVTSYLDILEGEGFIETHTTPQSFFMHDEGGKEFNFDRILIFENVVEEFNKMCQDFNINKNLQHKQIGNKPRDIRVLDEIKSNPDLLKRIENLYKKDFEIYNKHTSILEL